MNYGLRMRVERKCLACFKIYFYICGGNVQAPPTAALPFQNRSSPECEAACSRFRYEDGNAERGGM
jgi:hypothetical protein